MAQSKKKHDTRQRIKNWLKIDLRKIIFNPFWLAIAFILIYIITYVFQEIAVVYNVMPISFLGYLQKLNYDRAKDLVDLLVTTNVALIAFTGVIATMILKYVLQKEKEERALPSEDPFTKKWVNPVYKYTNVKTKILKFITITLFSFFLSIFFSFGAILTESYSFTILISVTFLFLGLIELIAMIVFSLR